MHIVHLHMARKNPEKAQRYHIVNIPTPIESFSFNNTDFSILLNFLNDKLEILEQARITPNEFPYQSYAEARVFLKSFFIFFRILLDDLSGVIGYFYKNNERIELPKSFNKLLKKAEKGTLPADLRKLLELSFSWFPKIKNTRDDLVHYFDSILLTFQQGIGEKNVVGYFNREGRTHYIEENVRKNIGLLLSEYQKFIDNLLDHFDTKFQEWYGIIQGKSGRTTSIIEGGIGLWWAYKYGDYRNDTLHVIEDYDDSE